MKKNTHLPRIVCFGLGIIVALTLPLWAMTVEAADDEHGSHHLSHIKTQAQAEALKPGDLVAMACSMCKNVTIHKVTKDKTYVELMTIGKKHTCSICGGAVEVVGTGKGSGKNEEVKHVCSKCGEDAMFVAASKPSSGHSASNQ